MYLEGHDADGWTTHLKPFYRYMNKAVRATFTLKKGDATSLLSHTWNVVAHLRSSGRDFSVFDFLWNNLIFVGTDPEHCLPYAPYVMFLIETTSKTIYPKDYTHSHLRIMKKRGTGLPPPPGTIRSASGVPVDDTPAAAAACVAQAAATTAAVVGHDPYRPSHWSSFPMSGHLPPEASLRTRCCGLSPLLSSFVAATPLKSTSVRGASRNFKIMLVYLTLLFVTFPRSVTHGLILRLRTLLLLQPLLLMLLVLSWRRRKNLMRRRRG
ncbi:hypothetical protein GQ55_7G277900 [Panicum hallii var. hallii]|uniref:Uncharacterized protein n=1 Tax=Panicum hallii var. hallii TaxID=1504633 RepID=A0A2T7CZS2_9POAL|nr:hypothetical protein GQ55_7G277900 [Panicum hallii var. hallii]